MFQPGNKFGEGGTRVGSGRKPNLTTQQKEKLANKWDETILGSGELLHKAVLDEEFHRIALLPERLQVALQIAMRTVSHYLPHAGQEIAEPERAPSLIDMGRIVQSREEGMPVPPATAPTSLPNASQQRPSPSTPFWWSTFIMEYMRNGQNATQAYVKSPSRAPGVTCSNYTDHESWIRVLRASKSSIRETTRVCGVNLGGSETLHFL